MQQAVGEVEPHLVDEGHEKEQRDEADGMLREADHGCHVVGIGPEQQHFIGGPDRHAAHQRVEHVVVGLVAEQEGRRLLRPLPVVFEAGALLAPDIEPQMPGPVDQKGQHDVAEQDQARPTE